MFNSKKYYSFTRNDNHSPKVVDNRQNELTLCAYFVQ